MEDGWQVLPQSVVGSEEVLLCGGRGQDEPQGECYGADDWQCGLA